MRPEIIRFEIQELFDEFNHVLDFNKYITNVGQARVAILIGRNGIGKTTILEMIAGMLNLDFNIFRQVPFKRGVLNLSTDDELSIENDQNNNVFIVRFNDVQTKLGKRETGDATEDDVDDDVELVRAKALPVLQQVSFEKVDIHRSMALRNEIIEEHGVIIERTHPHGKLWKEKSILSNKVRQFLKEAQVDYKKYFSSESSELFPRILDRLTSQNKNIATIDGLISRLEKIRSSEDEMAIFGLTMNISDIEQLSELLKKERSSMKSEAVIAALEAYVETIEIKHEERNLIASRLKKFEDLIDKFLEDKKVNIDYEEGLNIVKSSGKRINELHLSSGEYHLLYMFVTALVSTRTGTTIAIDEPELSLHIKWQRELIKALSECSSGASPLFIFATHSAVIASEFQDKWIKLGTTTSFMN